jgi:hypothetical protein
MLDCRSNNRRSLYNLFLEYETMKTESFNYETRIQCESESVVSVDAFDDGGVWLSINVHGGHARAILTLEQALELLDAINIALSATEGEE